MKKILILLLTVLGAVSFMACSDDDEDLNIRLHNTQNGQLQLYADETSGQLSFYAPDAWSVSMDVPTRAGRVEWLIPEAISGEAGEMNLPLLMNRNITGENRTAKLTIFCGNTSSEFIITQLGIKKNGENGYIPFPEFIPDNEKPATIEPISFFVSNEDWYGHNSGSITRFFMDGTNSYRAYEKANSGETLGVTTQFSMIWGDHIFMVSKQGSRLVVADANTLKKKASLENIGGGDGRAACGVDANTVYISTSSNIGIFDISQMKITGVIAGIESGSGLYDGQAGDMVRSGNYVFAAIQGKGIAVIDCATHKFVKTIGNNDNNGVCVSRDGYVWITGNPILKINPWTLEIEQELQLPSPTCTGGRIWWGAWSPTSLCAGTQSNCIYWNEEEYGFCRYDIDNDMITTNLFPSNNYGVSRIEPVHDYYTSVNGSLHTISGVPVYNNPVVDVPHIFPSHPFFEDANAPVILTNQIWLEPDKELKICLSDMVYDADDAARQIIKTLSFENTDNALVTNEVKQDTLYIRANGFEGFTSFDMKVCSHGKEANKNGIQIIVKKTEK